MGSRVASLVAFVCGAVLMAILLQGTKFRGLENSSIRTAVDTLALFDDGTVERTAKNNSKMEYYKSSEWKLWHTMAPEEQTVALQRAMARAKPYGTLLGSSPSKFHATCADGNRPILFGKGGEHMVCGPRPPTTTSGCRFLSFGIRDDPSFDVHLAEEWNCRGFAGDPSITHPSKLHPLVTFHNIGLQVVRSNAEQRKDPTGDDWILVSLPSLRKLLGWDYLDIVKIDCEGCEVGMAQTVLAEDPSFLSRVGQISIETHATRTWVNTTEELYYYALMFPLLEDAGFQLIWSSVFGCGKYEHDGCRPEMQRDMNMSCGNRPRNERNLVPIGWSCHDWLWARTTTTASTSS